MLTNWLDPSVTDERDPVATDQSLNMYNKENGPPYSDEFITRYRAAQRVRNQRRRSSSRTNSGVPSPTLATISKPALANADV